MIDTFRTQLRNVFEGKLSIDTATTLSDFALALDTYEKKNARPLPSQVMEYISKMEETIAMRQLDAARSMADVEGFENQFGIYFRGRPQPRNLNAAIEAKKRHIQQSENKGK